VLSYLSDPAALMRTKEVSIFNLRYTPDPWRGIMGSLGKYAMSLNYRGDLNIRHNMQPGPMLDVVLATLFVLGFARSLRLLSRPGAVLPLS
jgi:hypothetical protein